MDSRKKERWGDMSLTVLEEFLDEGKETFRNFPPCVDCVGGALL